jgi:TonB family protein
MSNGISRKFIGRALLGAAFCLAMGLPAVADAARALDRAYPNYQPPYPDTAQVNGEQGDVVLKVRVNQDGHVRNIEVEKSSGFDDLDNAAIGGVLSWHYLPSERWSSWEHVTIAYRLPTAIIVPPSQATH